MYEKSLVLCKDFLPEGRYHNPSPDVLHRAESCPAENIVAERLMARFDQSVKQTTHANQSTREAKIMYSANHTSEWLNTLEPKAQDSKLILARKTWQKSRVVF